MATSIWPGSVLQITTFWAVARGTAGVPLRSTPPVPRRLPQDRLERVQVARGAGGGRPQSRSSPNQIIEFQGSPARLSPSCILPRKRGRRRRPPSGREEHDLCEGPSMALLPTEPPQILQPVP